MEVLRNRVSFDGKGFLRGEDKQIYEGLFRNFNLRTNFCSCKGFYEEDGYLLFFLTKKVTKASSLPDCVTQAGDAEHSD